jgi:hypothetical protein
MADTITFRASMSHRCKHGAPRTRAGVSASVAQARIEVEGRSRDWTGRCEAPITGDGLDGRAMESERSTHAEVVASFEAEGAR